MRLGAALAVIALMAGVAQAQPRTARPAAPAQRQADAALPQTGEGRIGIFAVVEAAAGNCQLFIAAHNRTGRMLRSLELIVDLAPGSGYQSALGTVAINWVADGRIRGDTRTSPFTCTEAPTVEVMAARSCALTGMAEEDCIRLLHAARAPEQVNQRRAPVRLLIFD